MWPRDIEEMIAEWQRQFPLVLLNSITAVYGGILVETTCHTAYLWVPSEKKFIDKTNWKERA